MSDQWLSIAEAAAVMKIHPRTVERRAAAGKMQSRRNDDGQVQILIEVVEPPPPLAPEPAVSVGAFETVREMADRQVDIAAGSANALVRAAQEQAMRAENQTFLARQEAGRYRRETQMALALVAIVLLVVILAVGWCSTTITSARDRAAAAGEQARRATDDAKRADDSLQETRDRLSAATSAAAKASGELTAWKSGLATVVDQTRPVKPATRPATFVDRITQAFIGD